MTFGAIVLILAVLFACTIIAFIVHRRLPRKLKSDRFMQEWKELQKYCKEKQTWPEAIKAADKLFDKALKRRRFKGKSMGERMVSAQRKITNNDQMWFAHNMAKKIVANPAGKLKESEVKQALVGFRLALKDIGALQAQEKTATTNEELPAAEAVGKK